MFVSNVGGIIAAASKESAHPLRKTGKIPAIKRIVLSMQQAGLFPIVVVVGADDYESRYQLNNLNVVFLILEESDEKRELFHSVKAGLSYLQDKCLSVVFTPVNAPMFIPKPSWRCENITMILLYLLIRKKPGIQCSFPMK